jgi:serine/threonine protein kinase
MTTIQQYGIRALIGEGTLGTVYAAEDRRGRKAALKIMRDDLGREQIERFRLQAESVQAIGHAHLATIIEAGVLPGGQAYLLTERLRGETLGDRLRRVTCLPVPDALDFAAQAANALEAVHDRGLVHGGLTREDLFLTPDLSMRRGERVKILDAATGPLRGRIDPDAALPVGAALYLAPELWAGETADQRADVYALAALLYNALAGVPPHVATTTAELMKRHCDHQPTSLRKLNADVPAHVEAAIRRALAKDLDDRFGSVTAFVQALRVGRTRRTTSALRPVAAGLAAAICGLFLFSARAPGEVGPASTARQEVQTVVAPRPTIVPLPTERTGPAVVRHKKKARAAKPVMTALLDADLWDHRY